MKKELIITIAIVILFAIAKMLSPLNAKEARLEAQKQENKWEITSIYDITIIDGVKYYKDKEILCSYPLEDAISYIIDSNSVAYGNIDIEVKYISEEDIYIANIRNFIYL